MTTKQLERRSYAASFTVTRNTDGTVGIRGYAAVFGQVAYGECIDDPAFNRTVAQRDDTRCLVNHDGVPIARTKSGTLLIGIDERGLWFEAPNLDMANPSVQELVSAIERGDIDQCSFAGYFLDTAMVDGVRHVREVQLCDVSIVTYPWYDQTSVGLTGDRDMDRLLVSARSAPVNAATRDAALRVLRAAPPGKESYGDLAVALCDAIETMLRELTGSWPWMWLEDFGDDWAVYCIYGDGCSYFQVSYERAEDGTITLGTPFAVDRVTEYHPRSEPPTVDPHEEERVGMSIAEARALLDGLDPAA